MRKIFFLVFPLLFHSQVLERYPENQHPYKEGEVGFYKDFHKILIEKKLSPCENKQEMYELKLVVYEDASVKIIKEQDFDKIEKNKCSYELIKKVLPEMNGWTPAIYKEKNHAAVAKFFIYTDDLFSNFISGYSTSKIMVQPEFPEGLQKFRNKFTGAIRIPKLDHTDGEFTLRIAFDVDEQGNMQDVRLLDKTGYERFDESIVKGIQYLNPKYKWKPGTLHGIPVTTMIKVPIRFTFH